jgi:YHS domain-containing protein
MRRTLLPVLLVACAAWAVPACAQHYIQGGSPDFPHIRYADSLVSVNYRCTVRKLKMGNMTRPVYINGQPLGFCCRMCSWVWVTDPTKFLNEESIKFNCAVNPTRPAVMDSTHMAVINWEYYFFADQAAKEEFLKSPLKYMGKLTDPVSGKRFKPSRLSPKLVDGGRTYYFSSLFTYLSYRKSPKEYGFRRMD